MIALHYLGSPAIIIVSQINLPNLQITQIRVFGSKNASRLKWKIGFEEWNDGIKPEIIKTALELDNEQRLEEFRCKGFKR